MEYELGKWTNNDLKEYYEKFIELKRYKLAERVKKEMDSRVKAEKKG